MKNKIIFIKIRVDSMKRPYGLTMRGIARKNDEILILKRHPESRTNPNKWELPGGKVDPGEDFDKALIREFNEETNLNIELGQFVGAVQEEFPHKKTIALVMEVVLLGEIEVKISDEHIDWKWATIEEIKNLKISGWFETLLKEKNYNL
jgi:8-oxo-dGTP diphosphatase